jgi:hypothetical protein
MSNTAGIKYCLRRYDATQLSRRTLHVSEELFSSIIMVEECLHYSRDGDSRFLSTKLRGVTSQIIIDAASTPKSQTLNADGQQYGCHLHCTAVLTPVLDCCWAPVHYTDGIHPITTLLCTIPTPTHLSPSNPSPHNKRIIA